MPSKNQTRSYVLQDSVVFCKTTEKFGGLSNMASGFDVYVNDAHIKTVEALYQACRYPHAPEIQELILQQKSPITAKMISRKYNSCSRADWETVKVRLMKWCLRVKLAQNYNTFAQLLLSTGDSAIVELSTKDLFWGAKPDDLSLRGCNVMGRLLMELRQQLCDLPQLELTSVPPPSISSHCLLGKSIELITAADKVQRVDAVGSSTKVTQMRIADAFHVDCVQPWHYAR